MNLTPRWLAAIGGGRLDERSVARRSRWRWRIREAAAITSLLVAVSLPVHGQAAQDAAPRPAGGVTADVAEWLMALEVASHSWWLESDLEALDRLMMDDFRFIAMNGAVESKADVLGTDDGERAPRPLQIDELRVEPQDVVLREREAVVISLLHIRATVRGRPLPERMRIMSVFLLEEGDWRLLSRSITPILAPPEAPDGP